jgi:hypothetical protein
MAWAGIGDGAAIAGLVSVGLELLQSCIQGFSLIVEARNLGTDCSYLLCALRLEENRLVLWARRSGLSTGKMDQRLNLRLINETLGNIQNLLCDTTHLKRKYGLELRDDNTPARDDNTPARDDNTPARDDNTPASDVHLQSDHSTTPNNPDLLFLEHRDIANERTFILQRAKNVQRSTSLRRKFTWAAVDKKGFAQLINQIGHLIQRLQDLLGDTQQAALMDDIRLIRLSDVAVESRLDRLESMIAALTLGGDLNQAVVSAAQLKTLRVIEDAADEGGDSELCNRLLLCPIIPPSSFMSVSPKLLTNTRDFDGTQSRAIARYNGLPVYMEWKKYDRIMAVGPMRQKIFNRIRNLAILLNAAKNPQFRTLTCQALYEDKDTEQFCFLYEWPSGIAPDVTPKSLLQYLSGSFMPSLTDRLYLAKELAGSLLLFHTAGWLHKGFRSNNILFFPSGTRTLKHPFIVGFEYSRPDAPGEPSEPTEHNLQSDIYRHPKCQGEAKQPFRRLYDIYAFGLVLVEIAKWRPLEHIFFQMALDRKAQKQNANPNSISNQDQKAWKSSISDNYEASIEYMSSSLVNSEAKNAHPTDIAFRMGTIYKDVVLTCLRGDFVADMSQDETGKELQAAFFKKVVKKLEECVV